MLFIIIAIWQELTFLEYYVVLPIHIQVMFGHLFHGIKSHKY